jgi:ribosome-associated protein
MHQKPEASSELLKKFVVDGLQEIKGQNITIMDLRDIENAVTDFFVIAEGNSNTQVNALQESAQNGP